MLVLRRKVGERIVLAGVIDISVLAVEGERVKIGISAPPDVTVVREELLRTPATESVSHSIPDSGANGGLSSRPEGNTEDTWEVAEGGNALKRTIVKPVDRKRKVEVMLVLRRTPGKQITIDGKTTVTLLAVSGNRVTLGFEAPPDVTVVRTECLERNEQQHEHPSSETTLDR